MLLTYYQKKKFQFDKYSVNKWKLKIQMWVIEYMCTSHVLHLVNCTGPSSLYVHSLFTFSIVDSLSWTFMKFITKWVECKLDWRHNFPCRKRLTMTSDVANFKLQLAIMEYLFLPHSLKRFPIFSFIWQKNLS
jgi:hypothetical protein